jgi:hypothetical protein
MHTPTPRPSAALKNLKNACLGLLLAAGAAQAATVHLADIVAVPAVTIDFEGGPAALAAPVWLEAGVFISQVNSDNNGNDIWLASGLGLGQRSWYPDGGDEGWTRITLLDASNFDAVAMFAGAGNVTPPQTLYVELADNGVVVLSATLDATYDGSWFSFSGGDFDEIRLRAAHGQLTALDSCPPQDDGASCNVFWFDNLQIGPAALQVPEPAPAALLAAGLLLLLTRARGCHGAARLDCRLLLRTPEPARCPTPSSSPSMATSAASCCPPWPTAMA